MEKTLFEAKVREIDLDDTVAKALEQVIMICDGMLVITRTMTMMTTSNLIFYSFHQNVFRKGLLTGSFFQVMEMRQSLLDRIKQIRLEAGLS